MPALTRVCMWDETGWKRITAEEAARLHPGGTVSSRSGLFMCEYCRQYVTLTDGSVKVRHFRHSSAEVTKNCPERIKVHYKYDEREHALPLKIRIWSSSRFTFSLGLLRIPPELHDPQMMVRIKGDHSDKEWFCSGQKIRPDGITYVDVGTVPCTSYTVSVSGGRYGAGRGVRFTSWLAQESHGPEGDSEDDSGESFYSSSLSLPPSSAAAPASKASPGADARPRAEVLKDYWPGETPGVEFPGALFDASTGLKLSDDADVRVNKKYFLLTTKRIWKEMEGIETEKICENQDRLVTWFVYAVTAKTYGEETAKFFLDFRYRLAKNPAEVIPVWPVYVENDFTFYHSQDSMYLYVKGDGDFHLFPQANRVIEPFEKGQLVWVPCFSRQQMISVGRLSALQYTYFWKEPLEQTTMGVFARVLDRNGEELTGGVMKKLPEGKAILMEVPYDGSVRVKRNGVLLDCIPLPAGKQVPLESLRPGMALEVYVGLDLVWSGSWEEEETAPEQAWEEGPGEEERKGRQGQQPEEGQRQEKGQPGDEDAAFLKSLRTAGGQRMPLTHTIGALAGRCGDSPALREWIYEQMRLGTMSIRAYRLLQKRLNGGGHSKEKKKGGNSDE